MPVANERSRRFGFDKETVFETTAAGAYSNPPGYTAVSVVPDREALEREEPLNSFGDLYPADPGVQLFDASVTFKACKQTYAGAKRLFTGAMGQEDTGGALTINAAASTQSLVKISAGTPSKIVYVLGHNGQVYLVPVKTFTGGTDLNLAMQLPAAAVGATMNVFNPSAKTGGVFNYVLGGAADTFMTEFDRAGQSSQLKYRGWGCPVSAAVFLFELRKRIAWQFGFKASRWEKDVSLAVADPDPTTNPFISFACNVHLYQYTAAIAESNRTKLKKLAFSFGPKLIEETGTKALDGSNAITGSDVTGWTRAENWQQKLALGLTYADPVWHDRWDPNDTTTYYGLFCEFYSSKPAKVPDAPRMAVWFPYIQMCAEPKEVVVNQGNSMDLMFQPMRDPATGNAACYIAMTNN